MGSTDFQIWCQENHRYPDAAAHRDWRRGTVEGEMIKLSPSHPDITFTDLVTLTGGLLGVSQCACPYCDDGKPGHLKVTLYSNTGKYICFYCAAEGKVKGDGQSDPEKDAEAERKQRAFEEEERAEKAARGFAIWEASDSIIGTPVEAYLRQRGIIELPPDVDEVLRFHSACPMGIRRKIPCMVAIYKDVKTDVPRGIHRTAIPAHWHEGQHVERKTMGPMRKSAIKLWRAEELGPMLVIGEGIETVLSAAQCHRTNDGGRLWPAWALMNTENIRNFQPTRIQMFEKLYLLVDNDTGGMGQSACKECAAHWNRCGIDTHRSTPNEGDFNDLLRTGYVWKADQ